MEEETCATERWQLLQCLRSTVEALLMNGVTNVWSVYGGLNRLHSIMEKIFKHGSKSLDSEGEPDCWTFIQGLNWLQPSLASSPTIVNCENVQENLPNRIKTHKDLLWLYKSLEEHSLSQKLSWLLSDKEHLLSCLEPWAFLCQEKLAEATLVSLRAVEKKQPALLTEIDPTLYLPPRDESDGSKKSHRRSVSYPVSDPDLDNPTKSWNSLTDLKNISESSSAVKSRETPAIQSIELSDVIRVDYPVEVSTNKGKLKNISRKGRKPRHRDKIKSSGSSDTLNCEEVLSKSKKSYHSIETESTQGSSGKFAFLASSAASEISSSWTSEVEGQKDTRVPKKSFIEDGGSSVQPMATGYFPMPKKGQSLTSFLTSAQFTRANAELDRENAHFSISEAMIAAIEQLKCNKQLHLLDESVEESDEEINHLKQRIRIRRRQRQEEKRKSEKKSAWGKDLLSDSKTDTTTSVSPLSSSSSENQSESISTDDVDDFEMDDNVVLSELKNSGLSVSMGSLYSEADLFKSSPKHGGDSGLTDSMMSAEGVALSLISKFSEKHLPRASDLKWLVSEEDAPQMLLPLPKIWPIPSEDGEFDDKSPIIPLRGTVEWAPPRPQIIFTCHPAPAKKTLIVKQNYRCAGCGMKVAPEYAKRLRYCEYLGRYFCTGCHTNQVALIPGKILSKWDFNRYPVSNFSYRLLDQMTYDPLFRINVLNPSLYRRVKQLDRTRLLRTQLLFLKDFLFTCRYPTKSQDLLKKEPEHIISDPEIYSIHDFTQVKIGIFPIELNKLVQECCKHVAECVLCQARGFLCELCNSKDIIYPWELDKVQRCDKCGVCYHVSCSKKFKFDCIRCNRLQARRESLER